MAKIIQEDGWMIFALSAPIQLSLFVSFCLSIPAHDTPGRLVAGN